MKTSSGVGKEGAWGMRRIILIKDKVTTTSWGFAFVEFVDVEVRRAAYSCLDTVDSTRRPPQRCLRTLCLGSSIPTGSASPTSLSLPLLRIHTHSSRSLTIRFATTRCWLPQLHWVAPKECGFAIGTKAQRPLCLDSKWTNPLGQALLLLLPKRKRRRKRKVRQSNALGRTMQFNGH